MFRRLLAKSILDSQTSEWKPIRSGVWPPIFSNFNLNHRHNFKPHLNFIFEVKIKSKFTFQIDIKNQIDLCFYLHFVFRLLSELIRNFIDQVRSI